MGFWANVGVVALFWGSIAGAVLLFGAVGEADTLRYAAGGLLTATAVGIAIWTEFERE